MAKFKFLPPQLTKLLKRQSTAPAPESDQPARPRSQMVALLVVGLGGLSLGLLVYYLVWPGWQQITSLRRQLATNTQLLKDWQATASNLAQAEANYQAVEEQLPIIDEAIGNYSAVPEAVQIVELLVGEVLTEGGPLLIEKLSVGNLPADQPTSANAQARVLTQQEVTITLSLQGDYQAIRDFIVKLKSLRHNFSVERLVFASGGVQSSDLLTAEVTLKYYYFN